jgi:CubicO group peptidase (beta-lactamase class C family)
MSRLVSVLAIWGVLLAMTTSARADNVDRFIQAEMKRRHIPGLALAVVRDGKPVKVKGYGLADIENDVPVTPESVFELASLGKTFTATAVMMLVEEGKLRLDDPLGLYLPNPPEAWKEVTVRHLLTHTSGLSGNGEDFRSLRFGPFVAKADMYDAVIKDGMGARPGERWQYSDPGFFLLGMIPEKGERQELERLSDGADLPAAGADCDEHTGPHARPQAPRPWLRASRRRVDQHPAGGPVRALLLRRPLLHGHRPGEVGCRPLHREAGEEDDPGADVDADDACRR